MKRFGYILVLMLYVLLSCDKQPPFKPGIVQEVISAEINGVPFEAGITVDRGAIVRTDLCDDHMVAMSLVRKLEEEKYQVMYLDYTPGKPGSYALTDSLIQYIAGNGCPHDTVRAVFALMSYPENDERMATYRLLEGPWNYLKILYYDRKKSEIHGEFASKFVRVNNALNASGPVDTITYTNGKFFLKNMYVQDVITEPR